MLHELLLGLSGHPSPLLSADGQLNDDLGALISTSERALLQNLSGLGTLHNEVRSRAAAVGSSSSSVVSKAVAANILDTQLGRYQDKIIEIEKGILKYDSKLVAAYNAVPLSTIVVEFDGWSHILDWLKELLEFLQSRGGGDEDAPALKSSGQVLDHLRSLLRTGYPEIEAICNELVKVADAAWLRQLSSWLLYGKIPTSGSDDFFIKAKSDQNTLQPFTISHGLAPKIATKETLDSVLFVGKIVALLKTQSTKAFAAPAQFDPNLEIFLKDGVKQLSVLESPISPAALSRAVKAVRSSLARTTLHNLLPAASILQTLMAIHEYLLLQRGEFAVALITATDEHLVSRQLKSHTRASSVDILGYGGAIIKEAELSAILGRTWALLAAFQGATDDFSEDMDDEQQEAARELISLEIARRSKAPPTAAVDLPESQFEDLLTGTPTTLALDIPSPQDLFLSPGDALVYSKANAQLLGIQRAHLHLIGLWRLSTLRRTHPGPIRPVNAATQPKLEADRERAKHRNQVMRGVWASISATNLFLVELAEYFQGEVIKRSWSTFAAWIQGEPETQSHVNLEGGMHDLETLTIAHRKYLISLTKRLLLDDMKFIRLLRKLLGHVDHVVGLVQRLDTVVQTLMAGESALTQGPEHLQREEQTLFGSLQNARGNLDQSLSHTIEHLKEIEVIHLELGTGLLNLQLDDTLVGSEDHQTVFLPWSGSGIGRLIMKLESTTAIDGHDLVAG